MADAGEPSSRKSIVDPELELTDPTPDIQTLFSEFNEAYFYGALSGVEVKWAPRMTMSAGMCTYDIEDSRCTVKLSIPLLKLRPRKDLVQTLLHEMIHAYLFVTRKNKEHTSHGYAFLKHMGRINRESGADVDVFHEFHDEVDAYRQHRWQCDRCQYLFKNSRDRAPNARDPGWRDHKKFCGGSFVKVQEPPPKKRKQTKVDNDKK